MAKLFRDSIIDNNTSYESQGIPVRNTADASLENTDPAQNPLSGQLLYSLDTTSLNIGTGVAWERVQNAIDTADFVLFPATDSSLPNARLLTAGSGVAIIDDPIAKTATITATGAAGGAEPYLTWTTASSLTNNEILTNIGTLNNITLTPSGAFPNKPLLIDLSPTIILSGGLDQITFGTTTGQQILNAPTYATTQTVTLPYAGASFPNPTAILSNGNGSATGTDFQNGVWTPSVTSTTNCSISSPQGMYQRVGNVVFCTCDFGVTPTQVQFEFEMTIPIVSITTVIARGTATGINNSNNNPLVACGFVTGFSASTISVDMAALDLDSFQSALSFSYQLS